MAIAYIPTRDADFNNWIVNFSALLTLTPVVYGLTAPVAASVAAVTSTWADAYAAATNPSTRTAPSVAAKDSARVAAEALVRPYAVTISLNPAVSDLDKTAIGVTVRATVPTPVPAPTVAPSIDIESAIALQQTLTYKTPGASGKYKPPGVIGVEVFRAIGVVAATDPSQASYAGTVTKSPFRQTFSSEDQGKKVTYFCRYATRSGPGGVSQPGPFSAPLVLSIM